MGTSAAHCQGNVREFQSVWRVVSLYKLLSLAAVTNALRHSWHLFCPVLYAVTFFGESDYRFSKYVSSYLLYDAFSDVANQKFVD